MSNKLRNKDRGRGNGRGYKAKEQAGIVHADSGLLQRIIEYLLTAVLFVLCVVVPLYARDGYHQIGNAKFEAYRRIMLGGFGGLLILAVVYLIWRTAEHRAIDKQKLNLRLSATDLFVIAYLALTAVSVVSGGFYEDALWGAYGWNMGFLSQLGFVLLYLFLSRFGKYYRTVLGVLCLAATVVFCIGILHRLMFDPIGFYDGLTNEQKAQFLSTLGQATWYASFLIVLLPVGMGVFLYAKQRTWRILSGIYMVIGFGTLVTQNSDSAYFALAGMLIVFFMVSCEKRELLCRFTAMLTVFFGIGKLMYFLMQMRPNPDLEPDLITEIVWTSGLTWGMLVLCLLLTLALYRTGGAGQSFGYPGTVISLVRTGVLGLAAVLLITAVLVIYLQAPDRLPAGIADKVAAVGYLNWSGDWGNGRGRIWEFAGRVISQESLLHRIFGVGPDCFNSYVTAYHGEEAALFWGNKLLTNAHNEWLTILINGGILGAAAYLGIYVSAVYRFMRGRNNNYILIGITAAVAAYMCYNFFCYQQVLCTPFVFILMGMGEYILRNQSNIEKSR